MEADPNAVKYKIRGHIIFTVVALLGSAVLVLRGTCGGQSVDDAGLVAAGITGFVAIAHLLLALCAPVTFSWKHGVALLLVVLAPIAFLYPSFVRPANGWPLNPGNAPREVGGSRIIAPGDLVSKRWDASGVKAVGRLWRGNPEVTVLNADELGCEETIRGTGRNERWDSVIWSDRSRKPAPPTLSAKFRIPDDENLAGKTMKLKFNLAYTYPAALGRVGFKDKTAKSTYEAEVLIAPTAVKQAYWSSWRIAVMVGLGGTLVGGLMLVFLAFGLRGSSWASETAAIEETEISAVV